MKLNNYCKIHNQSYADYVKICPICYGESLHKNEDDLKHNKKKKDKKIIKKEKTGLLF